MNPEYPFQPPQQPVQQPVVPQGFTPQVPTGTPLHRVNPAKKWIILTFVFIFTTLAAGGTAGWALVNYLDQKNNVDGKVSSAVALAVKNQKETDQTAFDSAEKQPNRDFAGPDDYGRVAFKYPKTWSVYEAKDASSGGNYEAYFSPGVIPPITSDQRYALRLVIENKSYDDVISSYQSLVKSGQLKASAATIDGQNGTRLDGNFTKDIRGSAVILKIRDKTVTLRTDADTFTGDFNALVSTVTFNK